MDPSLEINKDLTAASSTPIVLSILAQRESYGYAILKRVQEVSGGRVAWTDGMLYPVLHRLQRQGYIEAKWKNAASGRRRKYYRLTSSGRQQLQEELKQWRAVNETIRSISKAVQATIPPRRPALALSH